MSLLAINDITLIGVGWIVVTLLNLAWGGWVLRMVTKETLPFFTFRAFWVGWVGLLGFLQIWHFFLPITPITLGVVSLIALIFIRQTRPRWFAQDSKSIFVPVIVIFALLMFLVSEHALRPFDNYDNALYHLQTIKWTKMYPIVPGLGNLHGRLAFNQAYFLFLTLFDFSWVHGSAITNGLLMLTLTLEGLGCLATMISTRRLEASHLLATILLIPLINLTFTDNWHYPASPNVDFVLMLISFKLGIEALRLLTTSTPTITDFFVMLVLAVSLPILKLSGAVFGALIVFISFIWVWRQRTIAVSQMGILTVGVALFLLVPWVTRTAILSGYLIYPSTIGALPVDWRISEAQALDDTNWVRSWARHPVSDMHWSEVLKDWAWVDGWWVSFWKVQGVRPGMGIILIAWSLTAVRLLLRRPHRISITMVLVWSLAVVGQLLFWFFSAPSPRFGLGYIWLLAAGGVVALVKSLPFLEARIESMVGNERIIALGITIMVGFVLISHGPRYMDDVSPLKTTTFNTFQTNSGLILYVPSGSELCWNAPLPCTPYAKQDLRLRKDGDLGSGFTVQSP